MMDKWNRFFAGQYRRHGWTSDAMAGRRLAARRSSGWGQAKRRQWGWPAEGSTKEGGWDSAAHRGDEDVVLGLAPSERHSATWLRLWSGSEAELTDNAPSHYGGRRRAAVAVRGVAARMSERRPEREDEATTPRGFAAPLHGLQVGEGFWRVGPHTMRKWGRQVGPTWQRIFQIKNTPEWK
jgi:hypothetical protein